MGVWIRHQYLLGRLKGSFNWCRWKTIFDVLSRRRPGKWKKIIINPTSSPEMANPIFYSSIQVHGVSQLTRSVNDPPRDYDLIEYMKKADWLLTRQDICIMDPVTF
jgi:hypothetical protein